MDPEDLIRALLYSIQFTLLLALATFFLFGKQEALGLAFGGIWSGVNIWTLYKLVDSLIKRRTLSAVLFAQLKMPVLYGAGGIILVMVSMSIVAVLVGFHLPFLFIGIESYRCQKREEQKTGH